MLLAGVGEEPSDDADVASRLAEQSAAASAAPWSVALAGGMGGAMAVQMPLQWMAYATELEVGVFQLDYAVKVAVQSAFFLAVAFLSFAAFTTTASINVRGSGEGWATAL